MFLLLFSFFCCKSDNMQNIHFRLYHVLTNYYESKDSQMVHGYYPRKYTLVYEIINPTEEYIRIPLIMESYSKFHYGIQLSYKGTPLYSFIHIGPRSSKNRDLARRINEGILCPHDSISMHIDIEENTLQEAGISREIDIKSFLDTLCIGYSMLPYSMKEKDIKMLPIHFNYREDFPVFLYHDTNIPWQSSKIKIERL